MNRKAYIILLSLFISLPLFSIFEAQKATALEENEVKDQREVIGTVLHESGLPIKNVKIKLKESKIQVETDNNGQFTLKLPNSQDIFTLEVNNLNSTYFFTILALPNANKDLPINIYFEVTSNNIILVSSLSDDLNDDSDSASLSGETCSKLGSKCPPSKYCDYADLGCGELEKVGKCKEIPNACIHLYLPVCGCNGRTYGNFCEAQGAGQSISKTGAC